MSYVFKIPYRGFSIGEAVPATFGSGVIQTLAARGAVGPAMKKPLVVKPVADPVDIDQAEAQKGLCGDVPNKALKPGRVKNKGGNSSAGRKAVTA